MKLVLRNCCIFHHFPGGDDLTSWSECLLYTGASVIMWTVFALLVWSCEQWIIESLISGQKAEKSSNFRSMSAERWLDSASSHRCWLFEWWSHWLTINYHHTTACIIQVQKIQQIQEIQIHKNTNNIKYKYKYWSHWLTINYQHTTACIVSCMSYKYQKIQQIQAMQIHKKYKQVQIRMVESLTNYQLYPHHCLYCILYFIQIQ